MTFFWPNVLWLLGVVPLLVLAYVWILHRKKKAAVRYANLAMVNEAHFSGSRLRRHVPPSLFLIAIVLMIVGMARPAAVVTLPSQHQTIILAMDVSGSMRATDVKPTRIAAAQSAAKAFIEDQPSSTRIGLVTFAASAVVAQPPTDRREDLFNAIDRFQLQRGTAVGSGILVSLKTIIPGVKFDLRSWNPRGDTAKQQRKGTPIDKAPTAAPGPGEPVEAVAPGSYPSAAIILLTDGQTTTGPDPIESARMAAERGVRVFTVGIGTPTGETIHSEGWTMRVRLDEEALKNIANITRGEYFFAGSAPDLKKIYKALNTKLFFEKRETEITAFFAAGAALLALLSAVLSMLWFNRLL